MAAESSSPPPPPLRIVICPWLAFGHLLPYLELAERLAARGHRVAFLSTPRNLARLPPLRVPGVVELVALPLPRVPGLPDGAESTNDVADLAPLWDAFDALAAPFADFLAAACAADNKPDWVVADTFHHWAPAAARAHGIPCATLLPTAAMLVGMACGARRRAELAPGATVFEQRTAAAVALPPPGMPRYEWYRNAPLYAPGGALGLSVARRCSLALQGCAVAAMRSCPEWEGEAFALAAELLGKPLVPLGLLPPSPDGSRANSTATISGGEEHDTVRWLDAQPAGSVVYVALGSEVPMPVEQVHELALGLELAGARFLWALRKPSGVPDGDVLPAGFEARVHGRGLVALGWVPQIAILAHAAVGAFLTHCGRNSLIEGLRHGHPLIMLPMFTDQGPNARVMEGRKVGFKVPRDDDDGSFDRHGVAKAVRTVMVDEDARRVFVANARKMQEIVTDKTLQERYIDEFVQQLRSYSNGGN